MENDTNKDRWISDAFEKAGEEAEQLRELEPLTRQMLKSYRSALPFMLMSIHDSFGVETALKAVEILADKTGGDILKAFYIAGYKEGQSHGDPVK